ncbi:flagellar export chaperone FliS [Roseateles saccharophilus]|uniref:Flagellar secretion chaperone FliS n=2 Tax=Roseateles saccharophilus TaxID=304 RepID=A0A4V2VRK3_ROSSA|nr:flagellar protein FliS [Roseateles saccharophilus]
MFSMPQSFGGRRPPANAYAEIGTSTATDDASPHKLIGLLYNTLLSDIHTARGAMQRGDMPAKAHAISRAVRIVDEGLAGVLDMSRGGEIAKRLAALYDYLARRLTLANLHNDEAALVECAKLVDTLKDAWDGIAAQVHAGAQAPSSVSAG